jgi:hypothetical protein
MRPDRVAEIERICEAALDRPSDERGAFVADACRDDAELRFEVESLLANASRAASFLEEPGFSAVGPGSRWRTRRGEAPGKSLKQVAFHRHDPRRRK